MSCAVFAALSLAAMSMPTGSAAGPGEDIPGDESGNGVQPVLVDGNPNCATYGLSGAKIDDPNDEVDEGAPNGSFPVGAGTVTVTGSDGVFFDWSSVGQGIDLVIVKGGDNADAFVYDPPAESFGDTDLHAPYKEDGTPRDISHVEFCFDDDEPPPPPADAHLDVVKFYDANANGINDDNQDITGWKVNVTPGPGDLLTPVSISVTPNTDITVSEYTPVQTNWVHTTGTSEVVNIPPSGTDLVEFGNLCLGGGGGHTIGFWSNKNGQALIGNDDLLMLRGLNLVNANGSEFNPTTANQVKSFVLNATAVNMANMLSAQLTAMELNVFNGFVSGNAVIAAPGTQSALDANNGPLVDGFATVNAVMAEANAALLSDSSTPSGDPNRVIQEALKNALDNANNNLNFVQAGPCPFSFEQTAATATAKKKHNHKHKHHGRKARHR